MASAHYKTSIKDIYSSFIRHVALSLLGLLIPIIVPATDLPKLAKGANVHNGTLENGVNYYVVTNKTQKGKVDIALVQKVGTGMESVKEAGSSVVIARGSLSEVSHFSDQSPQDFMASNGLWPGKEGYVDVREDATIYRFNEIDLPFKTSAIDSTLLLIFDIIGRDNGRMTHLYSPQNQAIVISGDIDASVVLGKMFMLSMLVGKQKAYGTDSFYSWRAKPRATVNAGPAPSPLTSSVIADYSSPRPSLEDMETVQPLVSEKYADELGIILRKRIKAALRERGIPMASVDFSYIPGSRTSGDEHYRIGVTTSSSRLEDATEVLSTVLADLDSGGVSPEEYLDSMTGNNMAMLANNKGDALPNSWYLDQCISAFLYGSSLAPRSEQIKFFTSKNLSNDEGTRLFNNFVSALLDRTRNLTLDVSSESADPDAILKLFDRTWTERTFRSSELYRADNSDTTRLKKPAVKVKVSIDNAEPLSGGRVWTFSNGIKVIYKKVSSQDIFHYSWLLKGGYSGVPDLRTGEGAYISDMLWQENVAGMTSNDFRDMLTANGITMDAEVTVSDFRISGYAPSRRINLVMKSLLALANEREINQRSYNAYRRNEALRRDIEAGGLEWKRSILDSLLSPGSDYTRYKRPIDLSDDFNRRCERFFGDQFSKMNDGVLIIVGNFPEATLKKILIQYMGGFRTEKVATFRTRSQANPVPGTKVKYADGPVPSVDLAFSAAVDYTVDNLLAGELAAYFMEDVIADEAASAGWYVTSDWRFDLFPEERFYMTMSMMPSAPEGLPATLMPEDSSEEMLSRVNAAIRKAGSMKISPDLAKAGRTMLSNSVSSWSSDPEMIIRMMILRYSYGKDLMSNQSEKVNSVTSQKIEAMLKALSEGAIAQYVVRKDPPGEVIEEPAVKEDSYPKVGPYPVPESDTTRNAAYYRYLFQGGSVPPADDYWNPVEIEHGAALMKKESEEELLRQEADAEDNKEEEE
ncbi:MAG: hypothetical protein IJL91_00620 [Bacteroidales bacterium]|nr:hypothetical protein [Bacteroidales bacterium]